MAKYKTKKLFMDRHIAAGGKVYGPSNPDIAEHVEVPEHLFDQLQERQHFLRESESENTKEANPIVSEDASDFDLEGNQVSYSDADDTENEEDNEPEEEIPTVDELVSKNRKYLESLAIQEGCENPASFSSKKDLAEAIVAAIENRLSSDEEEDDDIVEDDEVEEDEE